MACSCEWFCEACGDCLECYGGEACLGHGEEPGEHVEPLGFEAFLGVQAMRDLEGVR